ncbi:MAG: hypothetical protein ACK54J_09170 [Pseudanabaena sp.]
MAERSSDIFWVLNCPIYLLRCYTSKLENAIADYLVHNRSKEI